MEFAKIPIPESFKKIIKFWDNFTKGYQFIDHFNGMIPNYQNSRIRIFMYQKPSLKSIPSGFDIKTRRNPNHMTST
jgi:hypothetical protein